MTTLMAIYAHGAYILYNEEEETESINNSLVPNDKNGGNQTEMLQGSLLSLILFSFHFFGR